MNDLESLRHEFPALEEGGRATGDLIAAADERQPGRPLLQKVMERGRRLPAGEVGLGEARKRAEEELARLPEPIRGLEPADPPYPVRISDELRARAERARKRTAQS